MAEKWGPNCGPTSNRGFRQGNVQYANVGLTTAQRVHLANYLVYVPLLVLKGIYHYWILFRGLKQMEEWQRLFMAVFCSFHLLVVGRHFMLPLRVSGVPGFVLQVCLRWSVLCFCFLFLLALVDVLSDRHVWLL